MPLLSVRFPLRTRESASESGMGAAGALHLSLELSLTRLLNARHRMSIAAFLRTTPGLQEYGLPSVASLSTQSAIDLRCCELVILRAIALHEPRLFQVRVAVAPDRARPSIPRVSVAALAALEGQLCQFYFDTPLDERNVPTPAAPPPD